MSSNNRIKRIFILGGGTAGWMSAAALAKTFGTLCEITLVESDVIGSVGVGEATTPTLKIFNSLIGIDEQDFIQKTNGTFKLGIEFVDWYKKGNVYFHPFESYGLNRGPVEFYHYWFKYKQINPEAEILDCSISSVAAKNRKFIPSVSSGSVQHRLSYAYHFDSGLYANLLREHAISMGVTRVEGMLDEVILADSGAIAAISLKNGMRFEADLFIDCSGFSALLTGKALNTGFEDWGHYLLSDRAVVAQSVEEQELLPFTRSTAHESGWQWRIPLQSRVGNGHVYSSKYISDDEACQVLIANIKGELLTEPRVIQFRTGVRTKSWHKNCVAIGLSAGFLEPLESTSIYLIQMGVVNLIKNFPTLAFEQSTIDYYNKKMREDYIYVRDFVIAHYKVSTRVDSPFWRYCKQMEVPETLKERLAHFSATGIPLVSTHDIFKENNWVAVLTGQGLYPQDYHPYVDQLKDDELKAYVRGIQNMYQQAVSVMPSHAEFLAVMNKRKSSVN